MTGLVASFTRLFHRGISPAADPGAPGVSAVAAAAPRQSVVARMCQCLRPRALAARAEAVVAVRRRSSVVSLVQAERAADSPIVIHISAPEEPEESVENSLSTTPASTGSADRDLNSILANDERRKTFAEFTFTHDEVRFVQLSREFSSAVDLGRKQEIIQAVFTSGLLDEMNLSHGSRSSLDTQWRENAFKADDARWPAILLGAETEITCALRGRVKDFLQKEIQSQAGHFTPSRNSQLNQERLGVWRGRIGTPSPRTPESKSPAN